MSTAYDNGILKDSTPESFCEAVVMNMETGQRIRFRTKSSADDWCIKENLRLAAKGLAPRYESFKPDNLPEEPMKRSAVMPILLIKQRRTQNG